MLKDVTFKPEKSGEAIPVYVQLILLFLLISLGQTYLFSASWHFSRTVFGNPFRIWQRQLLWVLLGSVAGFIIYRLPTDVIRRHVPHLVWTALGLNLLTYIPGIGYSAGGARRWIEFFGFTFQPSEFTRMVLVLYIARMLEKNNGNLDNFRDNVLPPLLVVAALVLSVYWQNDFSTAAFLLSLGLILFFAAGISRFLTGVFAVSGLGVSAVMLMAKPYRLERLQGWFDPKADPTGSGYQLLKARMALEHGGFWGQGLGYGQAKRGGLPSAYSDFILAVAGEESGVIGITVILGLFTLLILKCWAMAIKMKSPFSRWGIFGLSSATYWQVLMNFAVVSGLLPATGIPLPLFSAGGSAAFITILSFGFIFNLGRDEQ